MATSNQVTLVFWLKRISLAMVLFILQTHIHPGYYASARARLFLSWQRSDLELQYQEQLSPKNFCKTRKELYFNI